MIKKRVGEPGFPGIESSQRKWGESLTTMFAKHYLVSSVEGVHSAKMREPASCCATSHPVFRNVMKTLPRGRQHAIQKSNFL